MLAVTAVYTNFTVNWLKLQNRLLSTFFIRCSMYANWKAQRVSKLPLKVLKSCKKSLSRFIDLDRMIFSDCTFSSIRTNSLAKCKLSLN